MHGSAIVLAAFAGFAIAQNSTVEFFWPSAATWEVPAITIQSVNASATVMHIACPSSQKSSCEWGHMNYTIFEQSTYEATMTNASYSITRTCVAKETPSMTCYMEGRDDAQDAVFAAQEAWVVAADSKVVATVESGGEKLVAASTAAASSSGPSPAAGSSATATASSTSSPQATGAAGENRVQTMFMLLGAAAAALCV
jgi:hypothetical protein